MTISESRGVHPGASAFVGLGAPEGPSGGPPDEPDRATEVRPLICDDCGDDEVADGATQCLECLESDALAGPPVDRGPRRCDAPGRELELRRTRRHARLRQAHRLRAGSIVHLTGEVWVLVDDPTPGPPSPALPDGAVVVHVDAYDSRGFVVRKRRRVDPYRDLLALGPAEVDAHRRWRTGG